MLVGALSLALTATAWWLLSKREDELLAARFQLHSEERFRSIEARLTETLGAVSVPQAFYERTATIQADEFRTLVRTLSERYSGVQALLWAPLAIDGGRDSFKVAMAEPGPTAAALLGLDLRTIPAVSPVLASSQMRRGPAASGHVNLPGISSETPAILIVAPVIRAGTDSRLGSENLEGYVAAVVRIDTVVEEGLRVLAPAGINVYLQLSDTGHDDMLYSHASRLGQTDEGNAQTWIRHERATNIAGRQWTLVASPSAAYRRGKIGAGPLAALLGGVAATKFLVVLVSTLKGQASRVTSLVT